MDAEQTDGTEIELGWQQIGLFPCGPYKARLEVWNPQQDNDTVLVSVEFRDASGHLIAMKVGSAARTDGDVEAVNLALEWYRTFWEALSDPFESRPKRRRRR